MGKIQLQIKCVFENVEKLSANFDEYIFYLRLICTNCRESIAKYQTIVANETVPTKNTKVSVNFSIKCKNCNRESTIDIIKDSFRKFTILLS